MYYITRCGIWLLTILHILYIHFQRELRKVASPKVYLFCSVYVPANSWRCWTQSWASKPVITQGYLAPSKHRQEAILIPVNQTHSISKWDSIITQWRTISLDRDKGQNHDVIMQESKLQESTQNFNRLLRRPWGYGGFILCSQLETVGISVQFHI